MMRLHILALLLAGLMISGCGEDNPISNGNSGNGRIAYIYEAANGTETPQAFKEFLDSRGLPTDLISVQDIVPADFNDFTLPDYSILIIDYEIGSGDNWGDSIRVALLELTDRPMIGLGPGGIRLFTEFGLSLNWDNAAVYTRLDDAFHTQVSVRNTGETIIDTGSIIYKEPNEIRFRNDSLIDLHYRASLVAVDITAPDIGDNVTFFGRQPDNVYFYSLAMEDNKYFLWGFAEPPEEMTDTGLNMFENIVTYLMNPDN